MQSKGPWPQEANRDVEGLGFKQKYKTHVKRIRGTREKREKMDTDIDTQRLWERSGD